MASKNTSAAQLPDDLRYISPSDLASMAGWEIHHLYNKIALERKKRTGSIPPVHQLPGSRLIRFRLDQVRAWFATAAIKYPGRLTKAEEVARRQPQRDPRTIDFIEGKADMDWSAK